MIFSPDDKLLAVSQVEWYPERSVPYQSYVRIVDLNRRDARQTLSLDMPVTSLAFSHDGRRLATGSRDSFARVWDVGSGKELLKLKANSFPTGFIAVSFSPIGGTLATGSTDGKVRLWSLATGELIESFDHQAPIFSIAHFPDGKRLATGDPHGIIRIWEPSKEERK